ncbi:MAG: ATP-binding cassette domain-containing protein [Alphaproteobacteria bacterium]|nr:ATP-binding cassette domain-containing protein [Alphaproteobacteria bacterium]MDP6515167.1 ATP-binding cassette domain-containing protein [Alphaproteobacteria bacterium]
MVEIKSLSKRFGPLVAVDDVSFAVDRGEVLGFLGPNGAGKSTTMRMITGFLTPSAGTVTVCGHDVVGEAIQARDRIGYLPEGAPLYADMTAGELLRFVAGVRSLKGAALAKRVDWAVGQLGLEPVLGQQIETLSKGFKRRVGFAQAILHDPDVLILDEPTDGLDPNQKHEVRTLIRDMAADKAIIISTHILEEVDAVCTRAMIIDRGRIVVDCTPGELAARSRHHNAVVLSVGAAPADELRLALEVVQGVAEVEIRSDGATAASCVVIPEAGRAIVSAVSRTLHDKGWEIDELRVESGRLEDVFRDVTRVPGSGVNPG